METDRTESFLKNQREILRQNSYLGIVRTFCTHLMADGIFTEYIEDVYVTARVDSLEQEKARVLKEILSLQQQRQP